jgi:hypothetical protein
MAAPTTFERSQNYPNPFSARGTFGHPATQIRYQLPQAVQVSLTIYNNFDQQRFTESPSFFSYDQPEW